MVIEYDLVWGSMLINYFENVMLGRNLTHLVLGTASHQSYLCHLPIWSKFEQKNKPNC